MWRDGPAPDFERRCALHVVLMDLDMPRVDGIEATRRVLEDRPRTAVLVLTSFSDRPRILGAIEAGACGYLLKDVELKSHCGRGARRRHLRRRRQVHTEGQGRRRWVGGRDRATAELERLAFRELTELHRDFERAVAEHGVARTEAETPAAKNLEREQTVAQLADARRELEHRARQLEELQERLRDQAERDWLTGLFNRRYLAGVLERADARVGDGAAPAAPLSVAAPDLDHFKSINDRFGHEVGDQVLARAARLLQATVRATDVVARTGRRGVRRGDARHQRDRRRRLRRAPARRARRRAVARDRARPGDHGLHRRGVGVRDQER
jgi:PleD family two-component response regulator